MFRKKRELKQHRRFGSLAFFFAILVWFIFGIINSIQLVSLAYDEQFEKDVWLPFILGFGGTLILCLCLKVPRLRIFIHEVKHAVSVALTGNKVTEFSVEESKGHVQYQMYEKRLHFEPFIVLAPYFLPLFSLPTLVFCIALEKYYRIPLSLILSVTLAIDLETAFRELHRQQTDLRALIGGFFQCALFLAGFHLWWFSTCLLWIIGGNGALIGILSLTFNILKDFAKEIETSLQNN